MRDTGRAKVTMAVWQSEASASAAQEKVGVGRVHRGGGIGTPADAG